MKRDPIDLAVYPHDDGSPAVRTGKGWIWIQTGLPLLDQSLTLRPLVAIDPESDQVERLEADVARQLGWSRFENERIPAFRAALRSLVEPPKPPRPEEPTGLGAVVEDGGEQWVRTYAGVGLGRAWYCDDAIDSEHRYWSEFTSSVRILSEGVTE